ncbi:MAG: hypothetical protein KF745_02875 [Phycisphaeraceae bacterium]|nr:hypothetical protein [Phycisphaeraceae bacterium]
MHLNSEFGPRSAEWLPTDPPRPAPALMTAAEAAAYLRLTEDGRDVGDAMTSLNYLVNTGRVRPCRVGRHNRFTRLELDRFLHEQTERYAPKSRETPNRGGAGREQRDEPGGDS